VEQKPKTVRKQSEDLLSLLVADWRPTPRQVLWAVRIAVVLSLIVAIGYFYNITLWDWIKLLIIPAAIAAAGVWFNQQQREREQDIAQQHTQDEALQAYLDHISQLLTDKVIIP
jgi:type III secretory pathway component EscS